MSDKILKQFYENQKKINKETKMLFWTSNIPKIDGPATFLLQYLEPNPFFK